MNISERCAELLRSSAYQKLNINVEPLRGNPFVITEADIVQGSFSIQRDSVDRDVLQIGNMTAADLSMTLFNEKDEYGIGKFDNVKFGGARLTVTVNIVDDENGVLYPIKQGVFTVDNQPRALDTISLTAMDELVRMDQEFDAEKMGIVFPCSVRTLVLQCLNYCGMSYNSTDLIKLSDTLIIQNEIVSSDSSVITCRQICMWACQLNCLCGYADENGIIRFKFYEIAEHSPDILQCEDGEVLQTEEGDLLEADKDYGYFKLTGSERFATNSELDEDDIIITGHKFISNNGNYPDSLDDEAYVIATEGNMLFDSLSDDDKVICANAVNDRLRGFRYRTFNAETFSFPHLWPLDCIAYVRNGIAYNTIISNTVFNLNGASSLEAKAQSQTEKNYASLGALTAGQKAIIDRIDKDVQQTQISIGIEARTRMAINEAMYNSMGFYSTTVTNEDGSQIKYCHDKPNLVDSKVVYKITLEGTAWTSDYKGNSTLWQYGVDIKGNAVFSTLVANTISANLIKTGILQSKNGASWINLDNGTFSFGKKELFGLMTVPMLSLDDDGYISMFGRMRSSLNKSYSFGFWGGGVSIRDSDKPSGSQELISINASWQDSGINFTAAGDSIAPYHRRYIHVNNDSMTLEHGGGVNFQARLVLRSKLNTVNGSEFELEADRRGVRADSSGKVTLFTSTSHTAYLDSGGTFWVESLDLISDRNKKAYIRNKRPRALKNLNKMKFYSYSLKNKGSRVKMGLMADEAPKDILGEDGKSINLYSYISYVAKAVQELSGIVKKQSDEIAALKKEIKNIKEDLSNENI